MSTPDRPDLKIGDTIWIFNRNHRVYVTSDDGRKIGPIYREHWQPTEITGETRLSWVTAQGGKFRKVRTEGMREYATAQEVEEDIWRHTHAHKITDLARRADLTNDQLRQIAAIVGYDPEATA